MTTIIRAPVKSFTPQARLYDLKASSFYVRPRIGFADPLALPLYEKERNVLQYFIRAKDIILGVDSLVIVDIIEKTLGSPSQMSSNCMIEVLLVILVLLNNFFFM